MFIRLATGLDSLAQHTLKLNNRLTFFDWTVVVAQLAKVLLLIPDVQISTPAIRNFMDF